MSLEYACIYHEKGLCKKDPEPGFINWCAMGPCQNETPSVADRIRAMADEELAEKILATDVILNERGSEVITLMYCDDKGTCADRDEEKEDLCDRESRKACVLRWLRSAAPSCDKSPSSAPAGEPEHLPSGEG